ncbi:phosphate/phosphite/phosphonate ABC transporter substrate-binding protein [Flaviaesturariibacter amylovorans]|uniref:Phosphate/phosphite/phosphonate ABC transporter substrate-binding protein n=1 Tax=Flaviaesturariibacter amylovorans TaxID=1084520 RepID=A0ABP8HQ41_9BACT
MKTRTLLFLFLLCSLFAGAQPLRLAVYQYADNPRIRNLEPVAAYLGRALGRETTVRSYPDVHALIRGLQAGEVDLAFISTFGYLLLAGDSLSHPMRPLCALAADQPQGQYRTAFVARREVVVSTWPQLGDPGAESLRLALVASGSTSGNLVPRLMLGGIGIGKADAHFASVRYAGTHARALELLLRDSADVAAMGSTEWERLDKARQDRLRLLALSEDIPLGPALVNQRLPAGLQKKIGRLLMRLPASDPAAFDALRAAWTESRNATRFDRVTLADYERYLRSFGSKTPLQALLRSLAH